MKRKTFIMLFLAGAFIFNACQKKQETAVEDRTAIDQEVLTKISKMGFSAENVIRADEGYIVEGDILLTQNHLDNFQEGTTLRIASDEQYRTTELVTGLPRVITISLASNMPDNFGAAIDETIDRYNEEDLQISFQRVSSGGDIHVSAGPWWWSFFGILGQGGFPEGGDPWESIKLNTNYFDDASTGYLASVIVHEIGHCIGFRHTDYMDRSYSCGGSPNNEGESEYGAIHIPGTPTGPDALSFMLSCSDGTDREFNANDIIALEYLY
jgi:hypothetical protein